MVSAYILILTEADKAAQVAEQIVKIEGVQAAEDVTGSYDVDLIVRAEASDIDTLGRRVVAKIQAIEGVDRTLTCPVVRL